MNQQCFDELVDEWLEGEPTDLQVDELNQILRESEGARPKFYKRVKMHGLMHCAVADDAIERAASASAKFINPLKPEPRGFRNLLLPMVLGAIAASLVIGFIRYLSTPNKQPVVAILVSSEDAAWESVLPTEPQSQLSAGRLDLKSGVATIRFESGAEVVLEAPAELELIDRIRGRLLFGAAVIKVPDSAKGFVVETPDGYAVDFGTQFAVEVDQLRQVSSFEVIEGEIAVHHPQSGEELQLSGQGKQATLSPAELRVGQPESSLPNIAETAAPARTIRLSNVGFDNAPEARLRLNLVPSSHGHASRLPKINRFGVYGITDEGKLDWATGSLWDEDPTAADGKLLATFEIPRSQQRGNFSISSASLLEFLKSRAGVRVTLVLDRLTTQIDGVGPGLAHSFASHLPPVAVGPTLEFITSEVQQ